MKIQYVNPYSFPILNISGQEVLVREEGGGIVHTTEAIHRDIRALAHDAEHCTTAKGRHGSPCEIARICYNMKFMRGFVGNAENALAIRVARSMVDIFGIMPMVLADGKLISQSPTEILLHKLAKMNVRWVVGGPEQKERAIEKKIQERRANTILEIGPQQNIGTITVKIGRLPGIPRTVMLNSDTTIEKAITMVGGYKLSIERRDILYMHGELVDKNYVLQHGDVVLISRGIT